MVLAIIITDKTQAVRFNYEYNTPLIDIASEKMILSTTYVVFGF